MLRLIKKVLSALLSFRGYLATSRSLNNEPCMIRPSLFYLNPIEFKYFPFVISLDKCSGSFNAADD